MTCHCFFIGWNIASTIRFTIEHYKSFCDKVTYYDNHSTDDSVEAALACGAEVRTFGIPGVLDDAEYVKVKNNCWKGSDADYVIVCDDDEILFDPAILFILRTGVMSKHTIFKTKGYSIFSEAMPEKRWLDITTGVEDSQYSKTIIFSPELKEINYVYGAHVAKPVGRLQYSDATLPILHYRAVGGAQRLIDRQASYRPRLAEINKRWGLGGHYLETDEHKKAWFDEQLRKSVQLSGVIGL